MSELEDKQLPPVSVFYLSFDDTPVGGVLANGPSPLTVGNVTYEADKEYWYFEEMDFGKVLGKTAKIVVELVAKNDTSAIDAKVGHMQSSYTLMRKDNIVPTWISGQPNLSGTAHYFFQNTSNDDPDYARWSLVSDTSSVLAGLYWWAKQPHGTYFTSLSVNDTVSLYAATAGSGGGYPDAPAYYDATVSA